MVKLITGGSGLVGMSFKDGIKINSKVDLRKYDQTQNLIRKYKPDVVVHCAAKVGGVGANTNYPADFYLDNLLMNTNIIDVCKNEDIKKLVCLLTVCIFPDKLNYPIDESMLHLGPPHESNFGYAYSKRMCEIQLRAYNKQFGTKYFSVLPTNLYGPHDNFNLLNGHVIPVLIHKCYLAKLNNTYLEVWGDGSSLREFIFVDDVTSIIDLLIKEYKETDPVIISNPIEYSIKEIVNTIADIMEFSGQIKWLTDKPGGQYRRPTTNKKLLSIIGDYKFTRLEDGLEKSINWFINNYNNARK